MSSNVAKNQHVRLKKNYSARTWLERALIAEERAWIELVSTIIQLESSLFANK